MTAVVCAVREASPQPVACDAPPTRRTCTRTCTDATTAMNGPCSRHASMMWLPQQALSARKFLLKEAGRERERMRRGGVARFEPGQSLKLGSWVGCVWCGDQSHQWQPCSQGIHKHHNDNHQSGCISIVHPRKTVKRVLSLLLLPGMHLMCACQVYSTSRNRKALFSPAMVKVLLCRLLQRCRSERQMRQQQGCWQSVPATAPLQALVLTRG